MIQLKSLLNEQAAVMRQPGTTVMKQGKIDWTGPVMRSSPAGPYDITGAFNAQRIAKQIYDAKGFLSDDEEKVLPAIRAIKNINQYKQVNKELQKLTGGRGMGAYLGSFLDINPRLIIAAELLEFMPKKDWNWTIKKIVPWNDFRTVAGSPYDKSIYDKWRAGETGVGEEKALIKLMAGPYQQAWAKWSSLSAGEQLQSWWKDNGHTVLTVLQIGTAFIPVIGWAVSAGIGLIDANEYRKEGDPKTAGLVAIFSVLPGIGKLVTKIPGVNQLGKKGMSALAKKLNVAKTTPVKFSKTEMEVLDAMAKDDKFVKQQIETYLKTGIAKNAKQIAASKAAASAKNGLLNFAKISTYYAGTLGIEAGYDYAYDVATAATLEQVQQQVLADLEQMYNQEMKNKK
jgi:hypothetical protein